MHEFDEDQSRNYVPVEVGDRRIYVEAVRLGEEEEVAARVVDFSGFAQSLRAVAEILTDSVLAGFGKAKPGKVAIEFGCEVGMETGTLIAVLVKGTAKANLKVTVEWTPS